MSVWDALDNNKILQGDCIEVLKTLPDESLAYLPEVNPVV